MLKRIMLASVAGLLAMPAFAADLPLKAARAPALSGYPYDGSGIYWGLGTFGEAEKLNTNTGAVRGDTFAAGAAVSVVLGYQWTIGPQKWMALEGSLNYANTGSDQICPIGASCTISSRLSGSQKLKLGGPVASMLSFLPDLSTVFPVLPPVPVGQTNPLSHPYVMLVLHEGDDRVNLAGVAGSKVQVRGGLGVGMMTQLSQGMVLDTWAEYTIKSGNTTVVGNGMAAGSGNVARMGVSVLY